LTINLILLFLITGAALWAVLTRSLLRSAIGLALTSAVLTIIMFRLNSSLAAVFELSICAGLITVIFIGTISLTGTETHKELLDRTKDRYKRYWYLPVILIIMGIILCLFNIPADFRLPEYMADNDVRNILWKFRQIDLLGMVIVLLAGVFGIAVLFKESAKK
jgi:NADH-quinone oxidoreductase subunit J